MKNKGMWILLGLTMLAVGYAVIDFQVEKKSETTKSEQAKLLKVNKEQINDIQTVGPNPVHLTRVQDGWQFVSPLAEIADKVAVDNFIDGLSFEKSQEVIAEGDSVDWKIFGLDQPAGKITVKTNTNLSQTFEVGSRKNYQGDSYVRITGENKVYLAGGTWQDKISKKVFEYRDKRWLKSPVSDISAVTVRRGGQIVSIHKTETGWALTRKPKWKMDSAKWLGLVSTFNASSVTEIVSEGSPNAAEIKAHGLAAPAITIDVKVKDKTLIYKFGKDSKNETFLWIPDGSKIAKINGPDYDKFMVVTEDMLRDRKEPFAFNPAEVKKVEVKMGSNKNEVVDSEKIKSLVEAFRKLEVEQFEAPSQVSGTNSFNLINEGGKSILELQLGESQKVKDKTGERSYVIAKSSLYPEPFKLSEHSVKELQHLVNPEVTPQSEATK